MKIRFLSLIFIIVLFYNCEKKEDNNNEQQRPKGIELPYVTVEGGNFIMGSPEGYGKENEHPQHQVTLSTFKISKYEITNAQFANFLTTINKGNHPKYVVWRNYDYTSILWDEMIIKDGNLYKVVKGKEDYPVLVEYHHAKAFAEWVGGRLPTEAEWEYSAKGGNKSKNYKYSGSNNLDDVAWQDALHPIGRKKANELGIYDMTGNATEWCSDWYDKYTSKAQINPKGSLFNGHPVIRGGDRKLDIYHITWRDYGEVDYSYGFRVVID